MRLITKYWLLKLQSIISLLILLSFAYWCITHENIMVLLPICLIFLLIQSTIFVTYWQPISKEYNKTKKEIERDE